MKGQLRGSALLFLTALIWGTAFVAMKSGMDMVSPLMFCGATRLIGGLFLIPVILLMSSFRRKTSNPDTAAVSTASEASALSGTTVPNDRRTLWKGGICCGLLLALAGGVQQIGLYYTTAGKAGFITAMYVILVPLFSLLLHKHVRPLFWVCVAGSAVGLYLLCIPAGSGLGGIGKGDLLILICAVLYAFHILTIDHFSPKADGIQLSCIQFLVAGILTLIVAPFVDPALGFTLPSFADFATGWFPLLYAGIMSCGVGFTLQIIGQKEVNPTIASMLLCLESVFSVFAGAALLGETLGTREIIGCLLMFIAIVVAQLPQKEPSDRIQSTDIM